MALVLSGDGSITGNPNITLTENVSIAGTVTYEDVTNVDSIGIVTARSGINVTGGSLDVQGNATITGTLVASNGNITSEVDLTGISSSISDTAVDVFVYDTSKDSDGGAWRKRTQYTSWYNETLGTSVRGTRKEFPSVAVIVCGTDGSNGYVHIYDGDDPDLPMWMVFSGGNTAFLYTTPTSVAAMNGMIFVGTPTYGLPRYDFIGDTIGRYRAGSYQGYKSPTSIKDRSESWIATISAPPFDTAPLVNDNINDVAMTVLPNAPIDDATGLPVPTIAVATDGGISVIKDDRIVVDMAPTYTLTNYKRVHKINFTKSNILSFRTNANWIYYYEIPSSDISADYWNALSGLFGRFTDTARNWATDAIPINVESDGITNFLEDKAIGHTNGVDIIDINEGGLLGSGMHDGIATNFNTGYQHGDIKGAFLSDTDTTNVTVGSAHYTETFTGSGDNTWGLAGSATISGGVLTLADAADSRAADLTAASSLTTGQKYIAEIEIATNTSQVFKLDDDGSGAGQGSVTIYGSSTSGQTGTFLISFTKTGSPRMRFIRLSGGPATITSFKIYTAEEADRSVNNNGLKVFGTVTKSAVATGADLVAYSGFSASNYLQQPYNSDLDFGTGDLNITFWFKTPSGSTPIECILHRGDGGTGTWGSGKLIQIEYNGVNLASYLAESAFSTTDNVNIAGATAANGQWTHYSLVRSGTFFGVYFNGELMSSTTSTRDVSNTSAKTWIGERPNVSRPLTTTSLALFRMSKSAPSAEQVKKMYEDEKVLFQENAACTLYGSSDAVTALAFDEVTDQLHVGTSSGRSDFQGLRRINNTTTAVTTAISAHDTFIIEQ